MKKIFTLVLLAVAALGVNAQTFWTENFGTGCNRGQLASAYTGSNGAWTITNTGTNDTYANTFYVSATSAGTGANQCASSCNTTSTTNRTLHVSNVTIVIPNFQTINADTGASYFSGGVCGFGFCCATDRRVESPTINCTGKTNVTVSFLYLEDGDAANDDASFWYYDGSTWTSVNALAKTPTTCSAAGQWTSITVALPASANNNANVKIGFHWINNDDGTGSDPSFSVDDITVSQGSSGINEMIASSVSVYAVDNNIFVKSANPYKVLAVTDILGNNVQFTQTDNMIALRENNTGIYFVQLELNGVRVTKKVLMQ